MTSDQPQWRLATSADVPFMYELVAAVDPRWWRCSSGGMAPTRVIGALQHITLGAIVLDTSGRPVGAAALFDAGSTGCATLDVFALPDPSAHEYVRRMMPEMVTAAFGASSIRHLYHERFTRDPDLLGELAAAFRPEVVLPEFALVDGQYEDRTISVLTADAFAAWHRARAT
jgi:hypothetical protein